VKQTPQSGLSFYGSMAEETASPLTVANPMTIQVACADRQQGCAGIPNNRSNYSAETRRAGGDFHKYCYEVCPNNLHGSHLDSSHQNMDASDPFAKTQALGVRAIFNPQIQTHWAFRKGRAQRQQYGGSFGMPIKKNKTFLFMALRACVTIPRAVPILQEHEYFSPKRRTTGGCPCDNPVNNQLAIINASR